MKLICIDDSNRPIDIPREKWVKKGNEYTPVRFVRMVAQNNELGVIIEEIDLTDCFPYECFAAYRFALKNPDEESEKENRLIDELEEVN
jgi:hypothetical protein